MKNFAEINRASIGAKKNFNLIEWLQTDSHGKQSATRDHHGTKSRELPDNPRLYRYPCATLALPLRYVAMIVAVLVMSMANIGTAWGTSGVITAASTTDLGKGNTPRYVVEQAGVGRLMKNSDGSSSWSVSDGKLTTGSSKFALQTYNAISSIVINGYGTGSGRTFSSMRVGTATNNYAAESATGSGTMSSTAESQTITITPTSNIAANSYVEITLSGNINIYSVELVYAGGGGGTSHNVSAVTSTGTNTYGSVSAGSTTVVEGGTTTITATPAAGYRVTNWAVSGTGASISPTGASNSTTTTLTMGTANATVTVTFGAIPTHTITYTNTKSMDNSANPTSYYEGVGVASFTKLRHAVGYDFTGWSPSSISSSATTNQTIDAQWTARAAAAGTGTLTYALAFGTSTITTSSITRNNGALYDATDVSIAHTSFNDGGAKNGCSGKLTTTSAKDASNYVELTFKIADGYTFTPTEVQVRGNAVSTAKTMEVELKDNAATPNTKSVSGSLAEGSTSGGSTVTLDFDASGTVTLEGTVTLKIFVYGATNHWRLGTSIIVNGTVASAAPSCTAPNHVDISGRWDRFGGETISLTATAYSSAGTGSPIADGNITGWQWEKLVGSTWTALSNGTEAGVTTSGATTKNLQIANCGAGNSGKYRCVVSTGATCSTASATATDGSEGHGVKVYVLECYNGGTTEHHFTRTGDSQAGTLTMTLTANTAYIFKVHADNTYYGNNGTINKDEANWVMCNSDNGGDCANNLTVNSGLGGTFTFGIEYSTSGSSSVEGEPEISVTYPRKTMYLVPNSDWTSNSAKFAFYYYGTSGTGWTDFLTSNDCGMSAEIPQWNGLKVIAVRFNPSDATPGWNGDGHVWNQTGDITATADKNCVTITDWNAGTYGTYSTPTYTISYNAGTGGSGTKTSESKTCGVAFTLPNSAVFTRTGYTQTGWAISDGGSQAYALGGTYTTNEDKTFYPVWTVNNYDLTWNLDGGTTTSEGTGIASGVSSNTTTSQAFGTALTAPTVTKTGYNFSAWSPAVASTMPAANTTYTATWTAKTTTITIDANTGNHGSTAPSPITATYGSALPSFTAAAGVSGYSLTGYFTTATSGTKVINADGTLVASTDYADGSGNWKYETATLTLYPQYEEESGGDCGEIIKSTFSGTKNTSSTPSTTTFNTTGEIGGTSTSAIIGDNGKLNNEGAYLILKLSTGTFLAGDTIKISSDKSGGVKFATGTVSTQTYTLIGTASTATSGGQPYYFVLAANADSIIVPRGSSSSDYNQNPKIAYVSVCRPCPECDAAPSAPTATSNGATAATTQVVSWTDGSNDKWDVYVSTSSSTPAAGVTPTASGLTAKTYTFTGLTASTAYYWWVRSVCDDTHKSSWFAGSSFETSAAPAGQTALVINTLYEVPDMIPSGASLTSGDQFFDGLSANTKFELIGSGSGSTTPKVNNNSSNDKTIDGITFDDGSMWFKGEASLTSNIPTTFGLSFIVPEGGGKLYLYFNDSGTSTNIKLAKSGSSGSKPTLTNGFAAVDVTAGTYYLYGTGTASPYSFYGLKLCSAYSVSITPTNVTKETGATGASAAVYGKAYTATFTANTGYTLPSDATVTIGGVPQTKGTGYTWTISDGTATLTVPAAYVTGAISISVTGDEAAPATLYTVTFMSNGGSAVSPVTQASEGASIAKPSDPTRASYSFDGWYKTDGTKVSWSYTPTADITLYARWEEECDDDGTDSSVDDVAASRYTTYQEVGGSNVVFTATPSLGFKYKDADGNIINNSTTAATRNNAYSCQIKSSSSNIGSIKTNSAYSNVDSISFYFAASDKSGCKIAVWCSTDNFSTDSTSLLSTTTYGESNSEFKLKTLAIPSGKKASSLQFKFRFTVTGSGKTCYMDSLKIYSSTASSGTCYHVYYHGNGAESGFVSDTTSYADGAKAVVLSYHDSRYPLTKEGYDFQGWATSAGGSAEYSDGQQITIDGADVHLYAKWAPASSALVTWTMNTDTGTWGASATSTTDGTNIGSIATERTAGGSGNYSGVTAKVTMAEAEVTGTAAPSNSANFTFTIKSSTKQVEISKFDCKVFNVSSGDRTYKAQISDEAGNVYNSTNTVPVTASATLTDASFVFGTGKILRGDVTIRIYAWKTSGSPTEFRMGPDVKFYGTVQDYACATPSAPTISGASEYAVGQTITLTASHEGDNYDNLTTYTWYRGADWATASASSPVQAAATGATGYTLTKTAVAADDDLFWCKVSNGTCDAHNSIGYNVNVYAANTITWNLNGGSWGAVEHKDSYSRFDDDYTLPVPTRDGYVFAGWYEVSDFSGVAIEILESGSVGDREYWAKWGSEVTVSWSVTKVDSKLYRGGGGYSVTAVINQADWDGSPNNGDKDELVLTATEGVTLKNIVKSINGSGKAQVTADFDITTDLDADATKITFTLSVPATENYGPAEIPHNEDLTSCAGSGYTEFFSMTPIANTCSITNTQAYNKSNHYTTCDCTSSATITTGGSATFGLYSSGSGTTDKYWEYSSTNGSKHSIANTWVVLYSTTQFVAGDSIVITNGNASSSGYYTIVAAASDNTADYHSASQVTAPSTTNPAKNTNYYYILPKSFVSSNYLVIRSSTSSSCYFKAIKAYHAASSGGVTPTLTWDDGAEDIATTGVEKSTSNDDFVYTASQDKNSLGAITYSSDNTSVATVNATTGQVHLAGEAGTATITATIAASGCFGENSISYTVTVEDDCDDVAGTIETEDLGCAGIKMTVTGHTAAAGVSYQWYKAGSPDETVGTDQDNYTTTAAGSYYVIVTNSGDRHCAKRSTNTVTVEAQAAATATKIVDSWYVKNGRRTPDIELVETTNAESFTVTNKGTSTVIWNSNGTVTTGFGGCDFRMGEDGIIYLNGTKANGDAPTELTGATDVELRITAIGCGSSSYQDITIHCQAETTRPSIAFVVDGTKGGAWDAVTSGHASGTDLYDYLNYNSSTNPTGAFDLTERNVYKTTNEKDIREHYSQFDAILITDDPSTDTKDGSGKSYVNAFGSMVDIRPILTMEAYVSKWPNWKAKGIAGSPSSPNPRQYEIRLECKDHEIYKEGLPDPEDGTNVWDEMIGGETFRHVILVDSTKGIYNGVAYNAETAGDQKPALQGFTGEAAGSLLGLGRILEGTLQAAIERQEEPAARLLVMGINAKALRPTSALTNEGKIILRNILHYLLKTNMEEVDDCSNYFTGATDDDWSNTSNWSKGGLPSSEAKVRILAPCVISGSQPHVAQVAIVNSGKSSIRQTATGSADCNGKLTIEATGALIVDGIVRTAVAPHFAYNDLMPTTPSDLTIGAAPTGSGTLIFDNSDGDTQASVQMYSKGSIIDGEKNYQYIGIPFDEVNALYNYYGSWLYSWSYKDSGYGWVKVPKGGTVYAWTGYCITQESQMTYAPEGTLAATGTVDIEVPADENMVVGNSWTAPIDINAFEDDDFENLTGNVYFFNTGVDKTGEGTTTANATGDTRWAAGTYVSVPIHAAPYSGDDHIPSMQGFFVKNESGSAGTLHLDYDRHVRGTTRDNYLSGQMHAPRRTRAVDTDKPVVVTIKVSGENYDDRLVLLAREDFSEGFDNGWDGDKWDGNESALYLYSPDSEGTENSVSAVPELEGTVIGFRAGEDDEYTMYFDYLNGDEKLYLWDTETGDYTVIKTGYAYAFTTADKEKHARFIITRSNGQDVSTDITSTASQGEGAKAKKLLIGNKMYIMVDGRLFDATGKIVK